MLAVAGELPGDDAQWAYEMKWDGIRAIATLADGAVTLITRTGRDVSASYPELQGMAGALGGSGGSGGLGGSGGPGGSGIKQSSTARSWHLAVRPGPASRCCSSA
jgi:hypothetical protein